MGDLSRATITAGASTTAGASATASGLTTSDTGTGSKAAAGDGSTPDNWASKLQGGLNRANITIADRSMDSKFPRLLGELTGCMEGHKDAYPSEGGRVVAATAATMTELLAALPPRQQPAPTVEATPARDALATADLQFERSQADLT